MTGNLEGSRRVTGLSRDGRVLWRRPEAVGSGPFFFDGTAFVHFGTGITRYDETGEILGRYDLRRDATLLAAAKCGDGYVLLWSRSHDQAFAEFVENDGDLVALVTFPRGSYPASAESVVLASNGEDAVAMWRGGPVQAMRFGRRGLIGGPVVLGTGGPSYEPASVVWDGQRYRIAWGASDGIHAADLAEGLAFASHVRLGDTGRPRLATAAGRTLLVSGKRNFVLEAGQAVSQLVAAAGPSMTQRGRDDSPDVAWAGDRYVAAWRHAAPDDGGVSIRARFFAIDGTPLGASFHVADVPHSYPEPDVAATPDTVLVVWSGPRPGGRRFDLHGFMFDRQPFVLDSWYRPSAAASDDGFMLFTTRIVGCHLLVHAFGARDAVIGPPSTLVTACSRASSKLVSPHVAWDGNEFGVRYDEVVHLGVMDARLDIYESFLFRLSRSGLATKPVLVSGETYSTGLAAADGRYFAPTDSGLVVVPHDLSGVRNAGSVFSWGTRVAFSTGRNVIVLDRGAYRVFTPDGRLRDVHPLPGRAAAGAGNGSGGALIAWQEAVNDPDVVYATVLPSPSPKQRTVRP